MINLEPIPKKIQERMFEKMRALGKHKSGPGGMSSPNGKITFDKMVTRTTFIKMVSNQQNPVTLMGGKLKDDGGMYAGYGMYQPRTYGSMGMGEEYEFSKKQNERLEKHMGDDYKQMKGEDYNVWKDRRKGVFENAFGTTLATVNSNSRPIPGIKSADISFKGGLKAMREATINWTCWDWDELNNLMPHFLAHGKTVLLEWGWIYDENSLTNLPTLIGSDGKIKENAFTDYKDTIINGKGDFDVMVGIIKNFEFTTREDGAFDCQTILSSVGVNMLDNPQPTSTVLDPGTNWNLNFNENPEDVAEKLVKATNFLSSGNTKGDENSLLTLNTNVTR